MTTKYILTVLPALLFLVACESSSQNPQTGLLPAPEVVDSVPVITDSQQTYYNPGFREDSEALLQQMLQDGIVLSEAWVPMEMPRCLILNSDYVIVLRLSNADSRVERYGFRQDPGIIYPNCGVSLFRYYDFRQ